MQQRMSLLLVLLLLQELLLLLYQLALVVVLLHWRLGDHGAVIGHDLLVVLLYLYLRLKVLWRLRRLALRILEVDLTLVDLHLGLRIEQLAWRERLRLLHIEAIIIASLHIDCLLYLLQVMAFIQYLHSLIQLRIVAARSAAR